LSQAINNQIVFLETLRRRSIQSDFPLQHQLKTITKYFAVTGPSCVGKTSASKLIASDGGYRHIEYEPYVASIKEKLIAPEDGE
jgi:hypothetical protein